MRLRRLLSALALLMGGVTALCQDFEIVHHFILPGGNPRDRLLAASDGNLYGTALNDGAFAQGAIYRFVPDGSGGFTYQLLYSFHGPDGYQPRGLLEGPDGRLYGTTTRGGLFGWGTAFVLDVSGALVQLHDFTGGSDGKYPHDMILGADAQFYGTTFQGGASDQGVVFRLSPSGDLTTLHEFAPGEGATPSARLFQGSDGLLYGVTGSGGATGNGTAFRIDTTGNFTTLHDFTGTDGQNPRELTQAPDGFFYGSSCGGGDSGNGTVFRMDASGAVTTLRSFDFVNDGSCPYTGVTVGTDGNLYGTAYGGGSGSGGTIYHLASDLSFHKDFDFPGAQATDPRLPVGALTVASDGLLYGTTSLGGSGQGDMPFAGTFFRFDPGTGAAFLHDFGSVTGVRNPGGYLVEAADGNLYGTSGGGLRCCDLGPGTVYRLRAEPLIVHEFTFDEGEGPNSLLAASDGNLYGTSANNGPNGGGGTVWRVALDGTLTPLHAFAFSDPGFDPAAGLTEAGGGLFYGSTKSTDGTVYSLDATNGTFTTLHVFTAADGRRPQYGHLVLSTNGSLYGITDQDGAGGLGTVFRLDPAGPFTNLHDFSGGADGGSPSTNPVQASDGNIYGTTSLGGGPDGLGTVFRVDASDQFATIHAFTAAEGGAPFAPVVMATDGFLYGTCTKGPTFGLGTVFRMDTAGNLTTLHEFQGSDGRLPQTRLLASADGMLYGTTSYGGPTDTGLVYRLDLATSPPSASAISPTSGPAAGGAAVTLSGDHFREGAALLFSKLPAHAQGLLDAFSLLAVAPALVPGTLYDVTVTNADGQAATLPAAFFADYLDAPGDGPFHDDIESIVRSGLTAGCGPGVYCRDNPVTRAQMAVFLLKAEHGTGYVPPPCTGVFADVACPSMFADWIEQLTAENIAAGCGGGNYCPQVGIRRDQMAAFLLKTEHGPAYTPPPCQGVFPDVACPSIFADWIEQLAAESVTAGCGFGLYCPASPSTRGQMAVFLVKTFGLP